MYAYVSTDVKRSYLSKITLSLHSDIEPFIVILDFHINKELATITRPCTGKVCYPESSKCPALHIFKI